VINYNPSDVGHGELWSSTNKDIKSVQANAPKTLLPISDNFRLG